MKPGTKRALHLCLVTCYAEAAVNDLMFMLSFGHPDEQRTALVLLVPCAVLIFTITVILRNVNARGEKASPLPAAASTCMHTAGRLTAKLSRGNSYLDDQCISLHEVDLDTAADLAWEAGGPWVIISPHDLAPHALLTAFPPAVLSLSVMIMTFIPEELHDVADRVTECLGAMDWPTAFSLLQAYRLRGTELIPCAHPFTT